MFLTTAVRIVDLRVLGNMGWNFLMVYHVIVCFFLFYGMHSNGDFERIKQEIFAILIILVYVPTFLSFLGLLAAVFKNQIVIFNQTLGIKSHRLVGVYLNSNVLGFLCVLSIISCFILMREKRNHPEIKRFLSNWLFVGCVLLNLVSLFLSDSNGSLLFLIIYLISIIFCNIIKNKGREKSKIKLIYLLALCVAFVFISLSVKSTTQSAFNFVVRIFHDQNFSTPFIEVGRGSYEITSGRNILFQQGIRLFKKFPILGIGARNLTEYARIYLPDRLDYEDLHNGYLTILVSWGSIGFVVFAFFSISVASHLCGTLFNHRNQTNDTIYSNFFSLIVAYSVYNLVEITLLSSISFTCVFFWAILGYAMCYVDKKYKARIVKK
jgi:O-antigen ligase